MGLEHFILILTTFYVLVPSHSTPSQSFNFIVQFYVTMKRVYSVVILALGPYFNVLYFGILP